MVLNGLAMQLSTRLSSDIASCETKPSPGNPQTATLNVVKARYVTERLRIVSDYDTNQRGSGVGNLPEGSQDSHWVKSSLSFSNGNCVEVANLPSGVGVRNSRDISGLVLEFTPDEWHAFIGGVHNGEFDRFGKN